MPTIINILDVAEWSESKALRAIQDAGTPFVLQIPLPSVDHSQSWHDPAIDYLHALYIGESLVPHCQTITHQWHNRTDGLHEFRDPLVSSQFHITPNDVTALAARLHELASWFAPDDDELDLHKVETLDEYKDTMNEKFELGQLHFLELAEECRGAFEHAHKQDDEANEE